MRAERLTRLKTNLYKFTESQCWLHRDGACLFKSDIGMPSFFVLRQPKSKFVSPDAAGASSSRVSISVSISTSITTVPTSLGG